MKFIIALCLCLLAITTVRAATAGDKCPVPSNGCVSQATQYSCLNPLYTGCKWSCGANNANCGAAYDDDRFPQYGTPNQNRKCKTGKTCCTAIANCVITAEPTLQPTNEPTVQPTPEVTKAPTKAPIQPTPPTKKPTTAAPTKKPTSFPTATATPTKKPTKFPTTRAPTNKCLPQPTGGCAKATTEKLCLGSSSKYSDCCSWVAFTKAKGGKCVNKKAV